MLLRQMKYFVAVVDYNSFTEAAEHCYISQSAISQQIQALERELQVQLLIRSNRHFSLTPAGEYFYQHSKSLLAEVDALQRETVRIGGAGTTRLRLGYLRCYGGQELYQAVATFSASHPEISMDILGGTHEELYDMLRSGEVDVILSDQRRAFSDAYVNFQLLQCKCYVELSTRNPLSQLDKLQISQLQSCTCILISSKEQQEVEEAYYRDTLGLGGHYLFAESLEEGRLMAVGNRGILPIEAIGSLPPTGTSLCRLPLFRGEMQLTRNYCLFWPQDHSTPLIQEFAHTLRQLIQTKA